MMIRMATKWNSASLPACWVRIVPFPLADVSVCWLFADVTVADDELRLQFDDRIDTCTLGELSDDPENDLDEVTLALCV